MIRLLLMKLILIAAGTASMAQTESYDIFSFTPLPDWKRQDWDGHIYFTLKEGNKICIITFYSSASTKGDPQQNFWTDWNDVIVNYNTITSEVQMESQVINGWDMILGTATGYQKDAKGVNLQYSLMSFSGPQSRGTMTVRTNDETGVLESEIQQFLAGVTVYNAAEISVDGSQAASSPGMQQQSAMDNQQPAGNNNQLPVTASGSSLPGVSGFPTPNEQAVIRSSNEEGWLVEATNEYIQYSNPEIKVVQYFFVAPEDPNSNTDDEDLFWRKFLSGYFSADSYNKFPNEPYAFYNRVESASGYATFNSNGQQYFLVWIVSAGLKCSFLAITSSEAVFQRYFQHPNDLFNLENFNYFTASEDDLQGSWVNSGFSGAMLYNTYSGMAAGVTYASVSEEYTFSGNTTHYFSSGATGTAVTTNTFTQEEIGTFQLSGNDLVVQVNKPAPKTHEYWCGFVAGKGGLLLKLANKKFTNQIDYFSRKR